MKKILDSEVRKQLFETLKDSGFSKEEAANVVSVKYKDELKNALLFHIETMLSLLKDEKYSEVMQMNIANDCGLETINEVCYELERINKLNAPKEEIDKKETTGK